MEGCMMEVPSWYGLALEKRLSGPCSSPSTLPSDISDCPMTSTAELLKQLMKMMKLFQLHPTAIHKLTLQHKNRQDLHFRNIFIIFRKLPMISMIHMVNGELPDSDSSLATKELSGSGSSPRTLCTSTYIAYPTKPQKRLSYHDDCPIMSYLSWKKMQLKSYCPDCPDSILSILIYYMNIWKYLIYLLPYFHPDSSDSILTPCIKATDASSFEENCSGHPFGPRLI